MNGKKDIIKCIEGLSGKYSGYEIFSDWVKTSALSISNSSDLIHGKVWEKREEQYKEIARKHSKDTMNKFSEMLGMLAIELEENICDVMGSAYMTAGLGSKQTGQFFTPFHLSYLCAELAVPKDICEENPFTINEPSCGGGGMIIAVAKILKDRGLNYQKCMKVVAQDLDWKGVYMTYVQLSLLGINAVVVQGDTLADPYNGCGFYPPERVLYTPAYKGVLI